jgi:CheY-like chemotaxis protein
MESNKKLILVVDDSVDIREFFELVLEGAGYGVASSFRVCLPLDGKKGPAS